MTTMTSFDCGNCNHHWQSSKQDERCPNCNSWHVMTTDEWSYEEAMEETKMQAIDHEDHND